MKYRLELAYLKIKHTCNLSYKLFKLSFHTVIITQHIAQQVSLAEQELLTLWEHLSSPPLPPVFSGACVTQSLVLFVMFCRSSFVILSFFFWALSFFDLQILITPLVSSNSSSYIIKQHRLVNLIHLTGNPSCKL